MSININASRTNFFQNISINKTNNNSNDKTEESNSSINLKQKNKQSSLMENLLKQKQSYNEQKQTLVARDMDPKEKKYKLGEVNKSIQEIDAQIQQLTIQEKQEEVEKQKDKISEKKATEESNNKNGDEVRDDIIISASLNELIKYNSSKETIHLLKDSKNRQLVEAGYITSNDNPNSYNNKRLSQISKSIATIDMTVSKKVGELNKSAEKIKAKTELALEHIKNKEDSKSDKDTKTTEANEDTKANDDNKNIKESKKS